VPCRPIRQFSQFLQKPGPVSRQKPLRECQL
jgi:hypothetical protein